MLSKIRAVIISFACGAAVLGLLIWRFHSHRKIAKSMVPPELGQVPDINRLKEEYTIKVAEVTRRLQQEDADEVKRRFHEAFAPSGR